MTSDFAPEVDRGVTRSKKCGVDTHGERVDREHIQGGPRKVKPTTILLVIVQEH